MGLEKKRENNRYTKAKQRRTVKRENLGTFAKTTEATSVRHNSHLKGRITVTCRTKTAKDTNPGKEEGKKKGDAAGNSEGMHITRHIVDVDVI